LVQSLLLRITGERQGLSQPQFSAILSAISSINT